MHFHMKFIAVHERTVYRDAFVISLDKCHLYIGTYDDFVKSADGDLLGMGGEGDKNKDDRSQ